MWDEEKDDDIYAEIDEGSKLAAWLMVGFDGLIFLANVIYLFSVA